jgi:hypothetical protein
MWARGSQGTFYESSPAPVREALAEERVTSFLTDFLVRRFDRTVIRELGSTAVPSCATPTLPSTAACSTLRGPSQEWR